MIRVELSGDISEQAERRQRRCAIDVCSRGEMIHGAVGPGFAKTTYRFRNDFIDQLFRFTCAALLLQLLVTRYLKTFRHQSRQCARALFGSIKRRHHA
jgi:hypothetical protein